MDDKIAQGHIGNVSDRVLSDRIGHDVHMLPQNYELGISASQVAKVPASSTNITNKYP
jgi:hypothetical protein